MATKEIQLLMKMKKLVREGKRRFKDRKDRIYTDDLANLHLTEEDAWRIILTLNVNLLIYDNIPIYKKDNETLVFKRLINKYMVYIKLKIEIENGEEVVCWSFHKDGE